MHRVVQHQLFDISHRKSQLFLAPIPKKLVELFFHPHQLSIQCLWADPGMLCVCVCVCVVSVSWTNLKFPTPNIAIVSKLNNQTSASGISRALAVTPSGWSSGFSFPSACWQFIVLENKILKYEQKTNQCNHQTSSSVSGSKGWCWGVLYGVFSYGSCRGQLGHVCF